MQLRLRPSRTNASALMITLVISGVAVALLVAYLRLIQSHYISSIRSQVWNNCLPLVEAGIEEALVQLNLDGAFNLAANGWTPLSNGFSKERTLGDGYYNVSVTYTNINFPVITCTGFLPAPVVVASGSGPFLAAAIKKPDHNVTYMQRSVRVSVRRERALLKGMVVTESLDLGGNSCVVDSFDSSKGIYSVATASDNGDVVVNSDVVGSAGIGNAKIKGHLSTGPKAKVNIGPNGVVGSASWHSASKKGVEPGWHRRDMNFSLPDVQLPWTGPAPSPITGSGNKYSLDDGNYELDSLNLTSADKMHVKGNAVLHVKGNVNISGQIKLNPGATLKLYVGGAQATFTGSYDKSDVASEFMIYGLPSNKKIEVSGVAAVIYAPSAQLTLTGNAQFYGSSVTRSVKMNGTTAFHYDEALSKITTYRQYVITSWDEL